jgi:hypothetical protein
MHIVIAALGILTAIYFFVIRARNAAEMTTELLDVADDVRAAARRFGFRRTKALHPVDGIEDANTAAATIAMAYLELHGLPTEEKKDALLRSIQHRLQVSHKDAEELMILGRWLMNECQGPSPAIARAARRLYRITGGNPGPLLDVIGDISEEPLSDQQKDALDDIRTAFRMR